MSTAGLPSVKSAVRKTSRPDPVEDALDWENHLILRVPEDVADKVNSILDDNPTSSVPELAIQLSSNDLRRATVRLGDRLMSAKIFDLPTVCEVNKTIDKKNIFKVADLSQIVVCSHDMTPDPPPPAVEKNADGTIKVSKKEVRQWQYPHGLTPPLKSVRRRRFRKTKKKKYMDAPEVEKELKRLLRADLEAEKVRWELVSSDDKKKEGQAIDEQGLFGDKVTSSEDEEDAPSQQVGDEEKDD